MAKLAPVICRCCKKTIDRNTETNWVQPSRNWFYHATCYEDWVKRKEDLHSNSADDEYKDFLWDYLTRDVKIPGLNFQKFDNQWHNFLEHNKKRMTAKGLFFTAKYYYGVLKGNVNNAQGGIGILPYVYDDSCQYWAHFAEKSKTVCEELDKQLQQLDNREVVIVEQRKDKKEKPKIDLAAILELEDEE